MQPSRRQILKWLSAGTLVGGAPGLAAAATASPLLSLRKLADGRPLIGTALPNRFDSRFTAGELEVLDTHFDSITPENCMKWPKLCAEEGEYRWELPDRMVERARKHGQKIVGHCLVFNRDNECPGWLMRDGEKPADAKLVWKRIEAHVATIMTRYKGRIDSWDVLNEFVEMKPPHYRETELAKTLGPDFPVRLFKLAAELDPAAKLTYNDYGIENPDRRARILSFVQSLQDRGCRIDVVGSQSHLEVAHQVGGQIDATIMDCAKLGVRCAFTELDVDVVPRGRYWNLKTRPEAIKQNPYADGCPDEVLEKQAGVYRDVFAAVMANRAHVDRVTLWGLTDAHSWLNNWPWKRVNHGLLFDRQAKPKPAFHAVAAVLGAK